MLSLEEVLVINTSDTSFEREEELFGDPLQAIWAQCLKPYLVARPSTGSSSGSWPTRTPHSARPG